MHSPIVVLWTHLIFLIFLLLSATLCSPACSPATDKIPDSSVKSIADSFFSTGEVIFNLVSGQAVTSEYFRRVDAAPAVQVVKK